MHTVVVKIGSSSLTDDAGSVRTSAIAAVADQVAALRARGDRVVVVTSGAVAAGVAALGLAERPADIATLQALSAAGQSHLMRVWDDHLGKHGIVGAQILLVPHDFGVRRHYLHVRVTFERLLELGCVPVVNENDAVANDEIRFGDNDRLAALVAHLVGADTLVLLTDTAGLFTADPRSDASARLVEQVDDVESLDVRVGGAGTSRGSGGMASKLAAARIAAMSGVRTVIAHAERPHVVLDAIDGRAGVGTVVAAQARRISARKLWIGFAVTPSGAVHIDAGARRALVERGRSLLPAGVTEVVGEFDAGDAIDVVDPDGAVVARGLAAIDADGVRATLGRQTAELPDGVASEVVHRDDLVVLHVPAAAG